MSSSKQHPITKNIATSSLTVFQRQELKYFISNNLVDIIIPRLCTFMELDPFSADGFYEIYSVYFDTHDWQAYYAKLDGLQQRQKFRIRSYYAKPEESENVFLEVKEKNNLTIFKRRAPVTLKQARGLMGGELLKNENPVYNEWRYVLARNAIKPKLLNSYNRLAFISEHNPGLRVTIDKDISYCMTNEIRFDLPTRGTTWSHGKSVIEIKFDRYVPQFITDMIRDYQLTHEPVSKYCDSVISNYLLI